MSVKPLELRSLIQCLLDDDDQCLLDDIAVARAREPLRQAMCQAELKT
jgi:hypothetical protein